MTTAATLETHGHGNGHVRPVPDATIDVGPVRRASLIAAAVGILGYVVLGLLNPAEGADKVRDFIAAYVVGFVFWASLPFGSLALTSIGYLTSASWNILLRRVFHANTRTLPVVAVLFLPLAASLFVGNGVSSPYWWADPAWESAPADATGEEFDQQKAKWLKVILGARGDTSLKTASVREVSPADADAVAGVAAARHMRPEQVIENRHKIHDYLNKPFFIVRGLLYFLVLGAVIYFVNLWSRPWEDNDDPEAKRKLVALAGPAVILWALLMAFAATDWVMSVEPTWASSMFPVVFGMNQFITSFAFGILVFYTLTINKPELLAAIKDKFRIDVASLTFAVTMVWAYATFCQYMLVWAGNLPEEAAYYLKRGNAGWEYLAYFLMGFHWLVPFAVFLIREVKTNPRSMQIMCVLLLCVCAADVVWWVLPAAPRNYNGLHVPMAFAAVLGVGGVWGLAFSRELAKRPILPGNREGLFLANWGHHH